MPSSASPRASTNSSQAIQSPETVRDSACIVTTVSPTVRRIKFAVQMPDVNSEEGLQISKLIRDLLTTEVDGPETSLAETATSVHFLPPALAAPNSIVDLFKLPYPALEEHDEAFKTLLRNKKIFADFSQNPDETAQKYLVRTIEDATVDFRVREESLVKFLQVIPPGSDVSIEVVSDTKPGKVSTHTFAELKNLGEEIAISLWKSQFIVNKSKVSINLPQHLMEDSTLSTITKSHFTELADENLPSPRLAVGYESWAKAFDNHTTLSVAGEAALQNLPE